MCAILSYTSISIQVVKIRYKLFNLNQLINFQLIFVLLTYWKAFWPLIVFIQATGVRLVQHLLHARSWSNYLANNWLNKILCISKLHTILTMAYSHTFTFYILLEKYLFGFSHENNNVQDNFRQIQQLKNFSQTCKVSFYSQKSFLNWQSNDFSLTVCSKPNITKDKHWVWKRFAVIYLSIPSWCSVDRSCWWRGPAVEVLGCRTRREGFQTRGATKC